MKIKELIKDIKGDLNNTRFLKSFLINSSFRLLFNHRIGKYLKFSKFKFFRIGSLYYSKRMLHKRNCQISYKATLGKGISFPHPLGIVIGDGVLIKDNVKIWHHVTLGSHGKVGSKLEYPTICENVRIYAGAKIIGGIKVGKNSIIAANAVVNIDIPADCTAVGIPAKIIYK